MADRVPPNGSGVPDWWCAVDAPAPGCTDPPHPAYGAELAAEVHPGHPLHGVDVTVVAHALGSDDILCRHVAEPDRYAVVHLTWSGRPEVGSCPTVDCDGTWADIREY
ncbi:hypothetical protein [Actinocatenispora rupis]|uniref:hypothetical protein n=1 Tax=Actinocatenispora rupis TaxID=519421 RepID=UPI0019411C44|nr:hypothetical protein [Actinocatenispora rupis]